VRALVETVGRHALGSAVGRRARQAQPVQGLRSRGDVLRCSDVSDHSCGPGLLGRCGPLRFHSGCRRSPQRAHRGLADSDGWSVCFGGREGIHPEHESGDQQDDEPEPGPRCPPEWPGAAQRLGRRRVVRPVRPVRHLDRSVGSDRSRPTVEDRDQTLAQIGSGRHGMLLSTAIVCRRRAKPRSRCFSTVVLFTPIRSATSECVHPSPWAKKTASRCL
jgi:hypothetical protein